MKKEEGKTGRESNIMCENCSSAARKGGEMVAGRTNKTWKKDEDEKETKRKEKGGKKVRRR